MPYLLAIKIITGVLRITITLFFAYIVLETAIGKSNAHSQNRNLDLPGRDDSRTGITKYFRRITTEAIVQCVSLTHLHEAPF